MSAARARVFEFAVDLDTAWNVSSDRGGSSLPGDERELWTPEHLVLAGLCRCVLTSLTFYTERAGHAVRGTARAHGTVTRREGDGRFAFVEIDVDLDVSFDPPLAADEAAGLLAKGERDCFVGASLTAMPTYRWSIDGEPTR